MTSDVFCKIIRKELPSDFVYEDEDIVAIKDINPQAPVHILIIPRKHIDIVHEATHEDIDILGKMMFVAGKVAKKMNIADDGYRLILNQGGHGGQLVPHLHLHLLGGKHLGSKLIK